MKSPTIPEVEPQFEKEIEMIAVIVSVASQIDPIQQLFQQPFQQQVIRCETPTLTARCRSSIFEETLTPDPSACRWLLDIISEDEHMVKESAHFILSENQLVLVVAYTFSIPETQDPYNREEIDEMLDKQLNISDQIDAYTKQKDDALLLLKAYKSELINAYSKTEADALFDDKLNIPEQIDSYSKIEDDALLLLKVDKTQLIVAYSKTKDDELR
ncbi:MAG: hypothetical protein EZS28_029582 [Streblomastix strix]|uniref:Uncharacterized protein n=1 Tax=Streblomastix strix TaxID=222440 RepID=A0A5J4UYC0_9EUKA|nr:MAG: hypothetical protein EZS28_029582 [Streblomastix strix]